MQACKDSFPCDFNDPCCPVTGKIKCDTAKIVYEVTCMKCFKPCSFPDGDREDGGIQRYFEGQQQNNLEFKGLGQSLKEVLDGNSDGFKCSYYGTSGHSGHKRASEHLNALQKKNLSYAMTKHFRIEHPEVDASRENNLIRFKIISSSIKFNLQRFITEAFTIEKMDKFKENVRILNSKTEWGC